MRPYVESMDATGFKQALERLGLRGKDAAEEMGLWPETVSRYATGTKPIPKLVARYLELRLRVLLALKVGDYTTARAALDSANPSHTDGSTDKPDKMR